MEDFPQSDNLHFLIVKFFALFTSDTQVVINLFCITTFVLPVLTGVFVMRRLNISYPVALACSLLYSFLPYHFIRLGGHHFLTCYYIVPLSILLAIRVYEGGLFDVAAPNVADGPQPRLSLRARWAAALVVCVLQASAGVYYAFFAMYFQTVAALSACLQRRRWQPLLVAGALVAATMLGLVANLTPNFLYWHRAGANPLSAARQPSETEFYGFKLTALLFPIPGHRAEPLAAFRQRYEESSINSNENKWSAQGVVANLGFLALLGMLLYRKPLPKLLESLSVLNLWGILFATTGGLGMIFSMIVMPQLRSQNRVSVFLAFYSLLCVAFFLSLIWRRYGSSRAGQRLMSALGWWRW